MRVTILTENQWRISDHFSEGVQHVMNFTNHLIELFVYEKNTELTVF